MIQEIAPHVFCNAYQPDVPEENDRVLVYQQGEVLCRTTSQGLEIPGAGELRAELRFAFSIDGMRIFLARSVPSVIPAGYTMQPTRSLRNAQPRHLAWAVGVGESLWRWYRSTAFCGSCGSPMEDSTEERARICPQCGLVQYPRICPAVIVAVVDGERLLLTRYINRPFKSYALVAGFNEIGESIEDTVAREVLEETGLHIKNLCFYRSQPWVFTDSLLMGFFAELDGSDRITIQESELAEAAWHNRDELPTDHSQISLTGEMIELFRNHNEPRR